MLNWLSFEKNVVFQSNQTFCALIFECLHKVLFVSQSALDLCFVICREHVVTAAIVTSQHHTYWYNRRFIDGERCGLKLKNNKWIQNYNNWLSKSEKKDIHRVNLKRQYLHCYDYCKTALDEKNCPRTKWRIKELVESKLRLARLLKRKRPWTEKTKFIYARKTKKLMYAKTTNWKCNWRQ